MKVDNERIGNIDEAIRRALDKYIGDARHHYMSAKEAARLCGITPVSMYAYLAGRTRIPGMVLVALMRELPPEFAAQILEPAQLVVHKPIPLQHACAFHANSMLTRCAAVLADALADGRITHREWPDVINAMRRLGQYIPAWLLRKAA